MRRNTMATGIEIVRIQQVREKTTKYAAREIKTPADLAWLFNKFFKGADREVFIAVNLSTRNTVNGIYVVSVGTLAASLVHPREVFKSAILSNANAVAIMHNHPSGDPKPSEEDLAITKRLVEAGKLLGIKLLDHVIVGENSYISLTEKMLGGLP